MLTFNFNPLPMKEMFTPKDYRHYDCEKCRSDAGAFPIYMIVCPDCGNKRCPQAINHRFKCTNSNEPYQVPQPKMEPQDGNN